MLSERISARSADGFLNVRQVRAFVRLLVAGTGSLPGVAMWADLDEVDLLVAEVVTNACRHSASGHAGGGVRLSAFWASDRLRIEVQDDGGASSAPALSAASAMDESGRGLLILDALADRWGHENSADHQCTVWFEVAR
ncbi:ATP-binding protein [Actinomadura macrotermitis]|nr:ATP-binding protein [Actinomadura macrotermitis]